MEEYRAAESGLLYLFYADDAAFDGSARCSAQLLKLIMERGADQGYFPKSAKLLFILDTMGKEEAEKREFVVQGLNLIFFVVVGTWGPDIIQDILWNNSSI